MTENFLRVQRGDKKDRDRMGRGREASRGAEPPSARQDWAKTLKAAPSQPAGLSGPGTSVPPAPLRLVPEALWGVEALPCHGSGHTVEEEGTGEEHGVITFQRNEVRAPLFPI